MEVGIVYTNTVVIVPGRPLEAEDEAAVGSRSDQITGVDVGSLLVLKISLVNSPLPPSLRV